MNKTADQLKEMAQDLMDAITTGQARRSELHSPTMVKIYLDLDDEEVDKDEAKTIHEELMKLDPKNFEGDADKTEVACPECGKRGGVRARKDAYADHSIKMDGSWNHESTAIMDDTQGYECFECGSELDEQEISNYNDVEL